MKMGQNFESKKMELIERYPDLMNTIIWQTQFVLEDMITSMNEHREPLLDELLAMTEDEMVQWVVKHRELMRKTMEYGILYDWDQVADDAMYGVADAMEEEKVKTV